MTEDELLHLAARLSAAMGEERLVQLLDLILEIQNVTGWGNVTIVVADRRIVQLKNEKSYK